VNGADDEREASYETVRVVRRRAQADEWALVLVAEGLRPRVAGGPTGFALEVPAAERVAAERALASFERENVPRPTPPAAPILDPFALGHALLLGAVLLASYVVTGPDGGAFVERARADAAAIRAGETWRAVTALGLHADAGHVFGNAIAGALFGFAVFQAFGAGAGVLLLVLAGALGNGANALFREAAHATIGASTAVFGGVGLLVGRAIVRRDATAAGGARWVPLGAGLALLAMLGAPGERVDFGAHVAGLAVGAMLGSAAAAVATRRLARAGVQAVAFALALTMVAAAWWRALAP
jgi:membrane associated rhomboid family serine protease